MDGDLIFQCITWAAVAALLVAIGAALIAVIAFIVAVLVCAMKSIWQHALKSWREVG